MKYLYCKLAGIFTFFFIQKHIHIPIIYDSEEKIPRVEHEFQVLI